ncbi:hypothetical protein ACNKW1_03475 [Thauera sp. WH-2]|jgi:4-amino-4-deoxy-L-arabinose transferase-like glycosyltransferase|uniref:hypothetical protein n=1 Tax=unclassified Thauera TaxID=2609274 RepID=UPI003AAF77BB
MNTPRPPGFSGWVAGLVAWVRRHRRLLLILLLLSLFFSVLGYFSNPVSMPGMCKIYG